MTYWDAVDDICYEFVKGMASISDSSSLLPNKNDEAAVDDFYDKVVVPIGTEVRDFVVEKLKENGFVFPAPEVCDD